jgi:hypothetical protein
MKNDPTTDQRRLCRPGEDSDNIKIDREFQNLIPPLSPSELADLHRSLDTEGCRDALIVWKGHDVLVDGHNRIKHCRDKGYPFPVVEKEFADRDAIKAYIIHAQLGRRNLSPEAESYLRGKRYLEAKHQGARTDLTSGQSDPKKRVSEQLAEEFKVGEKTIRRDGKFAGAVDCIIDNCGQEVRNLILSRDAGLTRGGVLRLARLRPEEQKKFIQELKESGKRPRKSQKAKRRQTITLPKQPKALVQALLKQLGAEAATEVVRALAEAMQVPPAEEATEPQGEQGAKRRSKKAK